MIKAKFYCKKCDHLLRRSNVVYDSYEDRYYCKFCDNSVIRTDKVAEDMLLEYIKYQVKHEDTDKYE